MLANTGEVGEASVFAPSINRFLRVTVLVTVITVVIFTQLGL